MSVKSGYLTTIHQTEGGWWLILTGLQSSRINIQWHWLEVNGKEYLEFD